MDYSTIIVGVLALIGTLAGSIITNSRTKALISYRIDQLEEKVNKHNNVIDRTYKLEQEQYLLKEQINVANHRIKDLENDLK